MEPIQNSLEKTRWTSLGDSFIALGNILQENPPLAAEEIAVEARTLYTNVYEQVCQFCSKVRWCWGAEQPYTVEELSRVCDVLSAQGLCKESAFSTKFQGRCTRSRQVELTLFHQIRRNYEQRQIQKQYEENKANIAQHLMRLGEQMKWMHHTTATLDTHRERLAVGYACSRKETL